MKDMDEKNFKKKLTPEQYHVLREKGTEMPFTGKYLHNKKTGVYTCAACGHELFDSSSKFDSHCGWPSFDRPISKSAVKEQKDISHFIIRDEVACPNCGSHLGHVFEDGPTDTGIRYCINSLSLDFKKEKQK